MSSKIAYLIIINCLIISKVTAQVTQTEVEQINSTVMKYIDGTANGNPDKVREAFHKDFNLFIVHGDTLRTIDGNGYIERVEKGKKYNRKGKIISIDYENDAASVKVEVYFPDTKRIATDYLLLLKINKQWKILHKIINLKNNQKIENLISIEKNGIEEIKETLSNYIDGTANGEPEKLIKAFHKDFNLYYIKKEVLSIISGKKYIENFKEGQKSNRIGNVLSIDYENNAGLAKVQVIMPERNRIAIDYLLLLKINGEWKIIHKSFTTKNFNTLKVN